MQLQLATLNTGMIRIKLLRKKLVGAAASHVLDELQQMVKNMRAMQRGT